MALKLLISFALAFLSIKTAIHCNFELTDRLFLALLVILTRITWKEFLPLLQRLQVIRACTEYLPISSKFSVPVWNQSQ